MSGQHGQPRFLSGGAGMALESLVWGERAKNEAAMSSLRLMHDACESLAQLQWAAATRRGSPACPFCAKSKRIGHKPECALASVLHRYAQLGWTDWSVQWAKQKGHKP